MKKTLRAGARNIIILVKQSSSPVREARQASDRPQSLEMIVNLDQNKERKREVLILEEFYIHRREGPIGAKSGPQGQAPSHTVLEGAFPGRSRGSSPAG